MRRQQSNSGTTEAGKPSNERFSKLQILSACQSLFGKELTDEEASLWQRFLDPISVPALRYAFDTWCRGSRFFPKPSEIGELVSSYNQMLPGGFYKNPIPKDQYGQGYGGKDMLWIFEQILARNHAENRPKDYRMGEAELEGLLSELDRLRGEAPAWRR